MSQALSNMASSLIFSRSQSGEIRQKGSSAECASVAHSPYPQYIRHRSAHSSRHDPLAKQCTFMRGEGGGVWQKASAEIAASCKTQRTCRVYADNKFVGFTQAAVSPTLSAETTKRLTTRNVVGLGQAMVSLSVYSPPAS